MMTLRSPSSASAFFTVKRWQRQPDEVHERSAVA
tara:strand:+ start:363 stop:464 length:102 start_codon:yes stop_codon:yes gene_type:complete